MSHFEAHCNVKGFTFSYFEAESHRHCTIYCTDMSKYFIAMICSILSSAGLSVRSHKHILLMFANKLIESLFTYTLIKSQFCVKCWWSCLQKGVDGLQCNLENVDYILYIALTGIIYGTSSLEIHTHTRAYKT